MPHNTAYYIYFLEKREEIKSRADFLPHHNSLVAAVFVYKQYSHHETGKDHNSFKVYETDIIKPDLR